MTRYTLTVKAGTAQAQGAFSVKRAYGVNGHVYTTVNQPGGLTGINTVKLFANSPVPAAWPGVDPVQVLPPGDNALVCILPAPADLLAGRLDSQLRAYLGSAPPGALVTAWQEGNDPSNGFWKQAGVTGPSSLAAMHAYMRDFTAANAPHVNYGADLGSSPVVGAGQDCTLYVPPGLSWYSFDGYDRPKQNASGVWVSPHTAAEVFAGMGQIRAKWPLARLAITETNTQKVTLDPPNAGQWFTDTYAVALKYDCFLYETWWGPPGTANPDWQKIEFTPGAAYVPALNQIAADAAA